MYKFVKVTSPGQRDLHYSKEELETRMRRLFNDTYVDLFMLELDTQDSARFKIAGFVCDVTVEGR